MPAIDRSFLMRLNESLAQEPLPPSPTDARVKFNSFIGKEPDIPLDPKKGAIPSKPSLKSLGAAAKAGLVNLISPTAKAVKPLLHIHTNEKECLHCQSCPQHNQKLSPQKQSPPAPARRSPSTKYPVSTLEDYNSWKKHLEERARILRDPTISQAEKDANQKAHRGHLEAVYDRDLRILADECIKDPSKYFTEPEIKDMIKQMKVHWEDITEIDKFQTQRPNIVQYNRMMLAFGLPIVHAAGCPCTLPNGKTPWLVKGKRSIAM